MKKVVEGGGKWGVGRVVRFLVIFTIYSEIMINFAYSGGVCAGGKG